MGSCVLGFSLLRLIVYGFLVHAGFLAGCLLVMSLFGCYGIWFVDLRFRGVVHDVRFVLGGVAGCCGLGLWFGFAVSGGFW